MASLRLTLIVGVLGVLCDGVKEPPPVIPLSDSRFQCFSSPFSMCIGNPLNMQTSKVLAPEAHHKDLIGWWKFDDAFGYDSSGNGAHGLPTPKAGPARGGQGASAHFDGTDFLTIPHSPFFHLQQMSVMFWMFLLEDSTGSMRTILRKGSSGDERTPTILLEGDDTRLKIMVSSEANDKESFRSVAYIPVRRWTHVALLI